MAKKLVLTNLKLDVTDSIIRDFLVGYGEIVSILLAPLQEGQQRYAYVEMALEGDAARIVRKLNHLEILGQQVSISREF